MLFNSIQFAIFFTVVTATYFLLPHRFRWVLLLAASCAFYMAFIPIYIAILAVTIVIDYAAGILIERSSGTVRKRILILSILSTCLVLFIFKYFNFFNQNLEALAQFIGWNYPMKALSLILPIGLSFHTFQSLSYVIEVYRGHQKAEYHFGIYALYVMFYPQLVAGPIERPQNLLWQFRREAHFDYEAFTSGLRLMAWGLFKKVVIADRMAIYVNEVYGDPGRFSGPTLLLATVGFAYQIYCDFSGYSDMAIGAARVMGFKLMTNFDRPYSSQSIGEFWKRWHISLSTWFRDYVYIPLGGNRVGRTRFYANLLITFLISGLWHGANWTYIIWGGLNGLYLMTGDVLRTWRQRLLGPFLRFTPAPIATGLRILSTFCLICLGWVFFRAADLSHARLILTKIATGQVGRGDAMAGFSSFDAVTVLVAVLVLEIVQWARISPVARAASLRWPIYVRWGGYYGLLSAILVFGVFQRSRFIYFQF